jgi:type IV pilus assembly protein PilC
MPNYIYTAKTLNGENKTGIESAKDVHQLFQNLKAEGLVLVKIDVEGQEKKNFFISAVPSFRVSLSDKIMMTRNLWIMVSTGLSIVRSFSLLANQTKNTKLKKALLSIKEEVNKGENFSNALGKHPDIFSNLFCSMVKVGEESGTLEEALEILSLQMGKEHELKAKIQQAMMYPLMIMLTMLGIGVVIMTFVFPQLTGFFKSLNADLPWYTKIMIGMGNFISQKWYFVILIVILFILIFIATIKTKIGRRILDTVLLKIPILSSLIKKKNSAVLIRCLSSLMSSGVPLVRSLEITSGTVGNIYFKEALDEAGEKVKKGEKLSGALKNHEKLFPFGVIEIMEVGEETGKSAVILKKLAEFYEEEVMNTAENLSSIIEPLLILVLGGGVAFFAFSIIEPMYSILGAI